MTEPPKRMVDIIADEVRDEMLKLAPQVPSKEQMTYIDERVTGSPRLSSCPTGPGR